MVSCFYKRNGFTKEAGYGNFQFILLPFFFFLEKKEIRKRQGRYKGGISERNNMDPDHVISGTVITGSNRESILFRLLYYPALSLFVQYWFSLLYQYTQYTQLLYWAILGVHTYYPVSFILGYFNNPALSDLISFFLVCSNRTRFYNNPIILYVSILFFGSL